MLTADNPHAPGNIIRYNFKEQTFKQASSVDVWQFDPLPLELPCWDRVAWGQGQYFCMYMYMIIIALSQNHSLHLVHG